MTVTIYPKTKEEFEKTKNMKYKMNEIHPGRSGSYRMLSELERHLGQTRVPKPWWSETTDYLFLNWIREASYVSKSFRNELFEVFWRRSSVSITINPPGDDTDDLVPLEDFLVDRPTARHGIVHLTLSSEWHGENWPKVEKSKVGIFNKSFEFLAQVLRLETLVVKFQISWEDVEDLLEAKGHYTTARATNKLVVSKSFDVDVAFEDFYGWKNYQDGYKMGMTLIPHLTSSMTTWSTKKSTQRRSNN